MIKCINCGKEFSYGRKISCHSTNLGMIFSDKRTEHKWNCHYMMNIKIRDKLSDEDISAIRVVDFQKPNNYHWNCETSQRFNNQNELIEREYLFIYE